MKRVFLVKRILVSIGHLAAYLNAMSVRAKSIAWFLCAVSAGSFPQSSAKAVNFTIDIPKADGESFELRDLGTEIENSFDEELRPTNDFPIGESADQSIIEAEDLAADVEMKNEELSDTLQFDLPLPESPIPIVSEEIESEKSDKVPAVTIYETNAFPVPICLEPNVAFWKSIYRDVDTDEALVHDRDDLSRIFGKVSVSGSSAQRRQIMDQIRERTSRQLMSLAAKLESGISISRLSSRDKELLNAFATRDQKPGEIRLSASRLRIQSGLQSRFDEGVKRSLELMPMITQVLRKYDVPKDIVFLPHVESSYMRTARSKVGAVGLWQIMPGTMRALMGRSAISQRTNPRVSTEAAAKLLRQNHRMLKSWPLALTAYNHGPAGVARGVRATGSTDLCTIIANYNSRSFRFASSNFYAQFLAARHVSLDKYRTLALSKTHSKVLQPLLAYAHREQVTD